MHPGSDEINEDIYPLLLPHVSIQNGALILGNIKIRDLADDEEKLCLLCNGRLSLHEILEQTDAIWMLPEISSFIVELPAPLTPRDTIGKKERVLIISPNPQTSYLSAGGTLLKWKDAEILNLICLASTADSIHPELFNQANEISAIRYDEGEVCSRICNCRNQYLNYPDYSHRKQEWQGNSKAELSYDLAAALKFALCQAISEFNPSVIMIPAAIGNHPDNAMINKIMIDFFKCNYFPAADFFLYQDFPYAIAYNMIDDFLWKTENMFVKIKDHFEDITEQLAMKELLYDVYFSVMEPGNRSLISHIAKRNLVACTDEYMAAAKGAEHFYQLIPFN